MATQTDGGVGPPGNQDLLINMLDQIGATEPDAVYAMWPVIPTSYEAGFREVTYAQLANMVNGLAWWLDDRLGKGANEIFAYIGPNDARTPALGLAGVKTGNSVSQVVP
jgi:acyl-coenzyme A synthetase/AMP-(fatty) acid ligase